jgi:hypothetical protein
MWVLLMLGFPALGSLPWQGWWWAAFGVLMVAGEIVLFMLCRMLWRLRV